MTRADTSRTIAIVRMEWPHSNLGPDAQQVVAYWHSILHDFDTAEVEAAVKELIVSGLKFAPTAGDVAKLTVERRSPHPDWDQAWGEIDRLRWRYHPGFPGRETPPPERFSHPLIAAFALPAWKELCLGPAPGTKDFGTFYAQQREAWKALAARSERGVALAAVGASRRRGELERPDWSRALPSGGGK
jgi:hypothetical protein